MLRGCSTNGLQADLVRRRHRRAPAIGLIHSRDNRVAARAFGQKLLAKVQPLSSFPRLGRVYARLGRDDVRELPVPPYRVIYRVHDAEQTVTILIVWHGTMQQPPRPPV